MEELHHKYFEQYRDIETVIFFDIDGTMTNASPEYSYFNLFHQSIYDNDKFNKIGFKDFMKSFVLKNLDKVKLLQQFIKHLIKKNVVIIINTNNTYLAVLNFWKLLERIDLSKDKNNIEEQISNFEIKDDDNIFGRFRNANCSYMKSDEQIEINKMSKQEYIKYVINYLSDDNINYYFIDDCIKYNKNLPDKIKFISCETVGENMDTNWLGNQLQHIYENLNKKIEINEEDKDLFELLENIHFCENNI